MGRTDKKEFERYDRQLMIDGFGERGQKRLSNSTVFVAGVGGLGSPVLTYLTVAGVGKLIIADKDRVELSNLNRQVLHNEDDVGRMKVESAVEKLSKLNSNVSLEGVMNKIDEMNARRLVANSDVIVDCLDNIDTRHVLNKVSVDSGIPLVHGSVSGLEGRVTVFNPPKTACFACVYPTAPPVKKFPVLGSTPGVVGTIQATEVIKILTGLGQPLYDRLLVYDGGSMTFREIKLRKNPECRACSQNDINKGQKNYIRGTR
ncbi:MAG: HesA/MoeB/ThiF family protein [Candidatus Altiarchaeota archaeon]